ncbi:MAG: hypothetical protein RIC55_09670 [Pirellulaceae bacterium]
MATTEQLQARYAPSEVHQIPMDRQLHCVRFSPCGKYLIGGDFDAKLRRFAVDGEEPFTELPPVAGHHGGWLQPIEFTSEGGVMLTADSWGRISAWSYDEETPQLKWTKEAAHDGWVRMLSISPDGKHVASCGIDKTVRLWSTADGELKQEFSGHQHDVLSVRFHPRGEFLVSGDLYGVIKKWDAAGGECVGEFDASTLFLYDRLQDIGGVWAMAFDKEGKTLAAAGTKPDHGGTVQGVPTTLLFEFESGKLQHTLTMGAVKDCYVHDVLLHDDGFVVAVTSGTPGTGQLLLHKPGDEQPFFVSTKTANCHSLSLHPDGKRLAVVSTNKGSNGNGRRLNKDGEYEGNNSPIHIFQLPAAEQPAAG